MGWKFSEFSLSSYIGEEHWEIMDYDEEATLDTLLGATGDLQVSNNDLLAYWVIASSIITLFHYFNKYYLI